MDNAQYDSPVTNSNYFDDYELDEFEEANGDDESEKDGTWTEDQPGYDFNIDFELDNSVIENATNPRPPVPLRKYTFRLPATTQAPSHALIRRSSSSSNLISVSSSSSNESSISQSIIFDHLLRNRVLFKMEILMPRRLEQLHQHCPHHHNNNNSQILRGPYLICK